MAEGKLETIGDLARAATELAWAGLRLGPRTFRTLADSVQVTPEKLDREEEALVQRVAYAIPRVAARVPWRAACLIQALAGRRWLTRNGIKTSLVIGVRKSGGDTLTCHAWLIAGTRVVIGGDVSSYQPLGLHR